DEEDVYLPLELLSVMFTDIACNYVLWNGETVLKPKIDTETLGTVPVEWYESKYMIGLLTGKRQREEDVIREDYAELCFTLDYLYGHPGPALLESGLSEKGLDAALDDIPELSSVKERLMSPDMVEYMLALNDLFNIGLNEGHCMYVGLNGVSEADFPLPELAKKIAGRSQSNFQLKSIGLLQVNAEVRKARQAAWGDEVYRECGSTAILRIDAFENDTAGWEAYYAGKGEIPMDAVGITWTGLKRASENPAIKNILFDLSANSGGSSDMLMYMMDLMFGEKNFSGYNVLTKQRMHAVVRSDKNLDGVFDEKDEEVKYDCFNYAVLTARGSFSCGDLFPFVMQEHGAVLLGEPTGGGSCAVQVVTLTNGGEGMMSSWLWALRDENGESVEGGCKTDLPIARIEPETPTNEDPRLSAGDYTPFFDDVMLDRMINEWFEEQALSPAAEMTPEELYATGKAAWDEGDFAKAMEYYQQAADAGNPEGLRGLGALYANGDGVDPDYDRAMEYFQQAADLGDPKTFYNIGMFYQYGMGVEQDIGKAIESYEKAGELGAADGYKELAAMYAYGSGIEPDPVKAAEYYQKAADMGDADACCQVAAMYAAGSGVPQDAGKALEYWQKAADLGMEQVFGTLGLMYYFGEGTQQDYNKAVTYLTQAAEQEDPTAMFALGECLRLGLGTEKDPEKALEWYRKALEAGYEPDDADREVLKAALGEEYDLFFPVPEEGKDYFVRTAAVLSGKEQVGSMDLRFYLSAPHVPCYGLKDYVNFMYQ
ncbi:MAG: S41 family peptidase, partial [Clostridia bacterium]